MVGKRGRVLSAVTLMLLSLSACNSSDAEYCTEGISLRQVAEAALPSEQVHALMGAGQLTDGRIVFSDFYSRRLHVIDPQTGVRITLGDHGDGPGEYRLPAKIRIVGDHILFSDMQAARFTLADSSGGQIARVSHSSGNQPFDVVEEGLFVRSIGEEYAIQYNQDGNVVGRRIPTDRNTHLLLMQVSGGGVAVTDSIVYVMNGLEPRIYTEDLRSGSSSVIELEDWFLYRYFDEDVLGLEHITELDTRFPDMPIHLYFGRIASLDRELLFVFSRLRDQYLLTLLEPTGSVVDIACSSGNLLGVQDDLLFFEEGEEGSQRIVIRIIETDG